MFVRSSGRTEARHDASALTLAEENARRRRSRPSCWVEQLIQRRPLLGQYEPLMNGLMRESHGNFKRFFTNVKGYVPYASPESVSGLLRRDTGYL